MYPEFLRGNVYYIRNILVNIFPSDLIFMVTSYTVDKKIFSLNMSSMRIFPTLLAFLVSSSLFSLPITMLYPKNYDVPSTDYEKQLVDHTKCSLEKSLQLQSNLTNISFTEVDASSQWRADFLPHYHSLSDITKIACYHLLNNLCNFQGASHLHIGLLSGDSYIAALYGNQMHLEQQIGVDWFKECPENIFRENCHLYLHANHYQIINQGCFDVDKSIFTAPIDIYFYDADHSLIGHEKAFTYYNDILADVFIAVIDDWNCPWIRLASFKAFTKLNYQILYQNTLPSTKTDNGQYIAVIRKPVL